MLQFTDLSNILLTLLSSSTNMDTLHAANNANWIMNESEGESEG